jgi:outer membrane protein
MNRTFTGFVTLAAALVSMTAFAQTSAAAAPAGGSAASVAPPTKVGIIRMQDAVFGTNEGKNAMTALEQKYQPKQAELTKAGQELDADRKQLSTQGDKMNEEAKATLQKKIEKEQRDLQTQAEAFQQDAQGEQSDVYQRLGQKVYQTLDKFAKDNGYAVILDVSNPQSSGVLWASPASVDVTEQVVNLYNASSGVAAVPGAKSPATTPRPTASAPRTNPTPTPKKPQ